MTSARLIAEPEDVFEIEQLTAHLALEKLHSVLM
jgi:hypothetical protein